MHECEKTVDVKIKQRHTVKQTGRQYMQTDRSLKRNCGAASGESYNKIIQFY